MSKKIKVAINGYGRIGRMAHRVILGWHGAEVEVAAINAGSSTDLQGWMYLLKYDSVYGILPEEIKIHPLESKEDLLGFLEINKQKIPVFSQKDPLKLPWQNLGVDVVIESTGVFTRVEDLEAHLKAGAKKVVLSAPAKDEMATFVLGVNNTEYKDEKILSNASCTTNCIGPVAKIMHEYFVIDRAMMTTIHSYTSDQRLEDGGHKDYRRQRAAAVNIIPTSTGATKAVSKVLPPLTNIFGGLSLRVPVPVGSLSDFTFLLRKNTTKEEINNVFTKEAVKDEYKGILAVTTEPLVSSDIIGNSHSAIVDLGLTQVVGGNLAKVVAWYDNEYGYANRLVEAVLQVG